MKKIFTFLFACAMVTSIFAADVTINAGKITDLNWTADNVYIINGWAFVDSLDVLNIQAGTVIKGAPGEAEASSALIVSRGGQIVANGTSDEPIIFTALADDLSGNIPDKAAGLWGGIIVLGYGQTNNGAQKSIEGISPDLEFGLFGGTEAEEVADQDAGEMSYISIRHGGTNIGEGNEINGLTLGATGSGTTFSFIEIIANQDDGVEFFGGAPRLDHILVAYCGDDSYDHDHGVRAYMQHIAAVQDTASWGEAFGEHDGGSGSGETSDFIAHPVTSNATFIGNSSAGDADKKAFVLRDNWSGEYHNSIFADAPTGILLEWREDKTNSYDRLMADDIIFTNNIFFNVADNTAESICNIVEHDDNLVIDTATYKKAQFVAKFNSWGNDLLTDPGVSIDNPVPSGDVSGADYTELDSWFENVDYKGAFDPSIDCGHWAGSWTLTYAGIDYVTDADDCTTGPNLSTSLNEENINLSVYPNPATELLSFSFDNKDYSVFTIKIYDVNGKVAMTESTESSKIDLNISDLATGIYAYSLISNNTMVSSGRVVIK